MELPTKRPLKAGQVNWKRTLRLRGKTPLVKREEERGDKTLMKEENRCLGYRTQHYRAARKDEKRKGKEMMMTGKIPAVY